MGLPPWKNPLRGRRFEPEAFKSGHARGPSPAWARAHGFGGADPCPHSNMNLQNSPPPSPRAEDLVFAALFAEFSTLLVFSAWLVWLLSPFLLSQTPFTYPKELESDPLEGPPKKRVPAIFRNPPHVAVSKPHGSRLQRTPRMPPGERRRRRLHRVWGFGLRGSCSTAQCGPLLYIYIYIYIYIYLFIYLFMYIFILFIFIFRSLTPKATTTRQAARTKPPQSLLKN